jgi:hypothetical protein
MEDMKSMIIKSVASINLDDEPSLMINSSVLSSEQSLLIASSNNSSNNWAMANNFKLNMGNQMEQIEEEEKSVDMESSSNFNPRLRPIK